ncbi:ubiquitin carboxyl-terminal hydrolase 1 isoform X1 [Scleropages formosus]|uniref:ubiquitin carboxyl-terminal hydrolase 1 isoform X1 n=1 Tax=Scleropages formosus TaxID=113540 RepID=UPI000878CAE0|nr:ubiquitin carboxyl-terminal hydrolase 1 isoform X1 [Scleropages formosus]XP_018609406.1 ubiquitin carboxyl-terminal hydrolase 1 isoform X1 [Scleropages formosus]XP_018609407.1 ubiquitin carboxyl-terminal hydrolase 1 isoform X1 [Scleropages formosus]XP_029110420.1 ubiquitin carboxyl-terminal hydrolase 1 isoform X1 [Scleropages formosus]
MPGLQTDDMSAAIHTPVKKNRLSLKFFQKKDTKRTLEFSESQAEEQKPSEQEEPESCDQVVPTPDSCVPLVCDKRDSPVPFVGLNNLGNTCYLNSILQVLYYCPGFKGAIKKLRNLSKKTEKQKKDIENEQEVDEEVLPMNIELLWSLHHLITSMEQLQSSFLFNRKKYIDSELATSPRRLLNTLRLLNPMYEGYLQHDAQEVLRCILGYIQEACESIQNEQKIEEQPENQAQDVDSGERKDEREQNSSLNESAEESSAKERIAKEPQKEESSKDQSTCKRKSDTEAGNAKKRSKCLKTQSKRTSTASEEAGHFTRSKRKSTGEVTAESDQNKNEQASHVEVKVDGASTVPAKRPKQSKLSWLKPSGKQPSIFSKFRSMGKISTHASGKDAKAKLEEGDSLSSGKDEEAAGIYSEDKCPLEPEEKSPLQTEEHRSLNLMERMFQGQLVLRTRCLECECYTERREDFQDISVPVQEIESCWVEPDLEVSPDPKQESKTLKWAISQFASVERIVGEDKYFCETCHHYTEAERSLLFDKTPEVVTIHLKCFAASGSGMDPYVGLSKVSTPLHTPLKLSLEEWCTRPSKEHYELFAVVMHSGVTISSGHYTTYVKMVNLKDIKVELVDDSLKPESPGTAAAEAYNPARGYNDGEVSISATSKAGAKKPSEGIGLLGGQRSVSGFDLGSSKQANPDKGIKEECSSSQGHQTAVKNKSEREPFAVASAGKEQDDTYVENSDDLALCNLLDYEGKWMLFDDSEVRLFEEKDFLNACSPETCTTSIPYLLFYKKVLE